MRIAVLLSICLSVCSYQAFADQWKQFRGPAGGKLAATTHPTEWDRDTNVAWSVPMQGSGWSSPIVIGDRVYLTSAESANGARPKGMMAGVASMATFRRTKPANHQFVVSCFSMSDGKQIWRKVVAEKTPNVVHPSNTYATESPATDGERLFAFFATTGTLSAWTPDGEELWRKELGSYKAGNGFGTGSSLAVADGKVFVQFDNDEKSFLTAFDAETGEQAWSDDRPARTSWSSPLLWGTPEKQELIACGSKVVTSYDPATGEVIWRLKGMESGFTGSPAIDGKSIYFGNSGPGSSGPLVAVNLGTRGEVQLDREFSSSDLAWSRTKSGPGMASPVVADGYLYIPGSGGILNCYDTKDGERAYRTRVPGMATVVSSLWADEDHVFILDENGTTHIIQAGPEFKVLGTNKIEDLFWSTPTVDGDTLIMRGVDRLYCIRKN